MIKYIERKGYRGGTDISIIHTEMPFPQAQMAQDLMRQMAIVAGAPDGVDEVGRQKLRLMTETEVVERAITIADMAFTEFRKRGWMLDLPEPKSPDDEKV